MQCRSGRKCSIRAGQSVSTPMRMDFVFLAVCARSGLAITAAVAAPMMPRRVAFMLRSLVPALFRAVCFESDAKVPDGPPLVQILDSLAVVDGVLVGRSVSVREQIESLNRLAAPP